MDLSSITKEGMVFCEDTKGKRMVVLTLGTDDPNLLGDTAITCLNPEAQPGERIYRKVFTRRPIYLPDQYELACAHLTGESRESLVVGMNGYSSITNQDARAWHIDPDAYRIGVEQLLATIIVQIRTELGEDVQIALVHGSSTQGAMIRGVDTAIVNVGKRLERQMLGFSCPRFMMYVSDEDDFPVYVASTQEDYSAKFVDALDVLVTCNGRVQTLEMDIRAAIYKRKFVVLHDLLGAISPTGGPPAYGADNEIQDAVKAIISGIHMVGGDMRLITGATDRWKAELLDISQAIIRRCRTHLPPQVGLRINVP